MAVLNNHVSACLLWLWIVIFWKVAQTYQASREPTLGLPVTYTREELLQLQPFAPVDTSIELLEIKPKAGAQARKAEEMVSGQGTYGVGINLSCLL